MDPLTSSGIFRVVLTHKPEVLARSAYRDHEGVPNLEVAAGILRLINDGSRSIVQIQGSQQPELVEKYGLMLEKLGMLKVTESGSDRLYTITEKGREFLAEFRQLNEDISGTKRRVLAEALEKLG